MIIEKKHPDYYIRGLTYDREAGSICLHWRYKEATDFLVFVYDSRQEFDLQTACGEITDTGFSDQELLEQTGKILSIGKGAFWKVAHITKAEFARDGRAFRLPMQELKKDVPYGICVFAGFYDAEKEEFHICQADAQENACFLPVKVKADIRYKTKFFSKEKYCMLRLSGIGDYRDGAILYHVDGVASDFPLPQACMGRELVIVIPRQAQVSIRIREEDKKYYSVSRRV